MAELTHDASRPTSTAPAGIAPQASGPASSDKGKLRVFISYSREDLKFADQLDEALKACSFECFIDRQGISGGEEWKRRLGDLISEADTVVFVLSPSSAGSPTCVWEVDEAARLNKRIFPVICRPLEGVSPPPRLRDLNYMFFYEEPKVLGSGFGNGLGKLVTALNTDFDWLREHTRYLQRAIEWDKGGRPANRLLSGNDILDAKAWAARRPKGAPEPTALQLDFIRASEDEAEARLSEQRKQLEAMAAAQTERETALHDREEALKQRVRVARVRNIALVVVSILFVLAGWLGWRSEQQRRAAQELKVQADFILEGASNIIFKTIHQMDPDTQKNAFAVIRSGAVHGDAESMNNLGTLYGEGLGVPKDYAAARLWYEIAAHKGSALAMYNLGEYFEHNRGVPQDYTKARDWYEKAAAKGDWGAMLNLGRLYANGRGVPQDWTKAREWWEKAAAKGNATAKSNLERLSIREAAMAGRYVEALQLQEGFAAKVETDETAREGKPGEQTARELGELVSYALFAKDFPKALTVADRAHALVPDDLTIQSYRAHALMFLDHGEECKTLYLAYKGKPMSKDDNKLWERAIAEDFADFRKAGLTPPMMADIEKELGVSSDGNSDIGQR
jgi:TPR repeat protein